MNSFRLRLAVVVGSTTTALLLVVGLLAWRLNARFNLDRLDHQLRELARSNLTRVNDGSHWERLDVSLTFVSNAERASSYVLWVENYGRPEYRSARWPNEIAAEKLAPASAYEGGVTFTTPPAPPGRGGLSPRNPALPIREAVFSTLVANGSTWRVAATGNPYTTLLIAANLDELNGELRHLRNRYLATLPLVLLVVATGAWWLASRAMRPVESLTRSVENITTQELSQRVVAPAHDREFQRLITVFNAMLDRLESGFHQTRRFSADASHELKTPLARLQAELEQALHDAPTGSPQQQTFSSLLEEIQRLKAIVEKLLLLSLADSGRLALERKPTDLSSLLSNLVEDCGALAPQIRLEPAIEPNVTVSADPILLEQALQNLVGNAVKYNRPGGSVRLTLTASASEVTVSVGNTGPGIPVAEQPRIFERFYRGDPSRKRDQASGTGLGLSLSREIIRAHDGELILERAEADWTLFQVRLPHTRGESARNPVFI